MNKKEWEKHCKWLDTFRGKIVTKDYEFINNLIFVMIYSPYRGEKFSYF